VSRPQGKPPARLHRIPGIDGEVDDDLVELCRVDTDEASGLLELQRQLDPATE
jgi:hypothetical protein